MASAAVVVCDESTVIDMASDAMKEISNVHKLAVVDEKIASVNDDNVMADVVGNVVEGESINDKMKMLKVVSDENAEPHQKKLVENAVMSVVEIVAAEPHKMKGAKKVIKNNNRIQVSNTKKPFFFYLNLAKWHLKKHKYVELSALGMAIPTAILISEILKRNGLAAEKKVMTFLVDSKEEENGHLIQKSKIMIVLEKAGKLGKTAAAATKASDHAADREI